MQRVSVVGNSGAGKSTLARELASKLGSPHIELDGIFHQPGWQELPVEEFRRQVSAVIASEAWVVDGNYSAVRDLVWDRADTVAWLDLPRRTVMRQVVKRTLQRLVRREVLWNGNREPLANLYRWDDKNIIRWAWTRHEVYADRFRSASNDPVYAHLRFIRLGSRAEIDAFLNGLLAT